ncbi:MAG: Fic family protein [Rhodothermia bacterium]|nr:MAG: Fic family protein [Rhodothermia bacterium]
MSFDPNKPFNELQDLPPDLAFLQDRILIQHLIEAHRALAELKGSCQTLPNPELLLSSVILHEGKDSSEIENIVTTQDELFRAASVNVRDSMSVPTREVLRYREAVSVGLKELRKNKLLTANTFIKIVQCLKGNDAGIRKSNVVIANPVSGEVIYSPPEGEQSIRKKLHGLERFIHDDDGIDPLVKLAFIHHQFEAIHPFFDGNGRTGRILNILFLIQQDLLELPVLYLSAFILKHKTEYYHLLRRVTERADWAGWVTYILQAVTETARGTLDLVRDINELMAEIEDEARSGMRNGYSLELIRALFYQPYCKIQHLVDAGIASRVTASKYLTDLDRLGILQAKQVHRDKYFVNRRLLSLLSNFGR